MSKGRAREGVEGLIGRLKQRGPRAPRALLPPRLIYHPQPGPDVDESGANELQDLGITSPEPAAIGWPSHRGWLLLGQRRLALGRNNSRLRLRVGEPNFPALSSLWRGVGLPHLSPTPPLSTRRT